MNIADLESENVRLKQQLEQSRAQNRRLVGETGEKAGNDDEHSSSVYSDNGSDEEPQVVWDGSHNIWLCLDCLAEIDGTVCIQCGKEYEVESKSEHTTPTAVSQAEHTDQPELHLTRIPDWRRSSPVKIEEYRQLISRGATPLMISTFSLCFSAEEGIIAHADDTLFDEFSGPAMEEDGVWKIYLGSKIMTAASFLEGLLEDAVVFRRTTHGWDTVLLEERVWETRPSETLIKALKHGYRNDDVQERREVVEGVINVIGEAIAENKYSESDDEDDEDEGMQEGNQEETQIFVKGEEEEKGIEVLDVDMDSAKASSDESENNGETVGSDWDSDEELSGDDPENLEQHIRTHEPYMYP
ncbi:hypothetical protein BKA70DRAFT_1354407 [Coprinopsis sp. MPI-PUGE-AT-0042]|nr:hypothetical protein BKA70DRAFT_1354407 [Coprinopsis sp. MPI-PUGE-AT-0042]